MWTATFILLLVGSLNAHPKGHLRGGDEEGTCRGIQELRKAPSAIISHLDCHETEIKDECAASTMDVLKFCIDGLKIDVDCVEKALEDDLDEDTQECFCGELGNFANMLHNLEMLVCSRDNSADSSGQRGGRSASGDGRGGRFLGGLGGGFWATSLSKPGLGSTSINTSFPILNFNKSSECGLVKTDNLIVNTIGTAFAYEADKVFILPTLEDVTGGATQYAGGRIDVYIVFDRNTQIQSVEVVDINSNADFRLRQSVTFSPGQADVESIPDLDPTADQPGQGPLTVNMHSQKNTFSFTVTVTADNGNFGPPPATETPEPGDNVIVRVRYMGLRNDLPKVKNLVINGQDHCN